MTSKIHLSSFRIWANQAFKHPFQFVSILIFIFLMIPLSLALLVLIPYVIQSINSVPAEISWHKLVGNFIAPWFQSLFKNTALEYSITLPFQKRYFAPIIIGISFAYALLSYLSDYFLRDLGEKIVCSLRSNICSKYLSLSYFDSARIDAGLLAAMVGEDMREVQQSFTRLITSLAKDGLSAAVFVVWLLFLDAQLFLLFAMILIPAAIVLKTAGKILKKLARHGIQFESDLLSGLLERMRGWQTIKVHNAIDFEKRNFNKINDKIYHAWRRATRARTLSSPLIEWLAIIAGTLIVIAALRRTTHGELNSSVLTSFVITIGFLSDKINNMANQLNTTRKGTEALRRVIQFLDTHFETQRSEHGIGYEQFHSIETTDISIGNQEKRVLACKINLFLKQRDFAVIIGPSGLGKSTLLRTLLGVQKPLSGKILVNEKELENNSFASFARSICFIPQEPFLFNGSIFENIVYPLAATKNIDFEREKAKSALSLAILDRDLDDHVTGLSGGEKQRLMFARIFYHKPTLIVIDEGTSAIDLGNEIKIIENMKEHIKNAITIVVAHRQSMIQFATQVIDLSNYKS